MFIAKALLENDETLLVLGLSRLNRERLEQGKPIDLSRGVPRHGDPSHRAVNGGQEG
jgi:hypothetical protein